MNSISGNSNANGFHPIINSTLDPCSSMILYGLSILIFHVLAVIRRSALLTSLLCHVVAIFSFEAWMVLCAMHGEYVPYRSTYSIHLLSHVPAGWPQFGPLPFTVEFLPGL